MIRGFSGMSLSFCYMLIGCYMMYSGECDNIVEAERLLPPLKVQKVSTASGQEPVFSR